jgi:hypothetical protein
MLKVSLIAAAASRAAAFGLSSAVHSRGVARAASPVMSSFYDFKATTLAGKSASMSDFKGKPVLILNVASL